MLFALEILSDAAGRLVERAEMRSVSVGDQVVLTTDRLHVHQGCGRSAPAGSRGAIHRLEIDDATVTYGVGGGHCQLWIQDGQPLIEDGGSDNGTWIERDGNVERIKAGVPTPLVNGDIVHVARVRLRLAAVPATPR